MNPLSRLLPDPASVRLETWSLEPAPPTLTLTVTSRSRPARCPLCSRRARRTHSWYERTLADLPWGEHGVAVRLRVRRLFCDVASCRRRVFTERLPGVVVPWARKMTRLADRLTAVGMALGGAAGARLSRRIGRTAIRKTLLHLVRQAPMPLIATPTALGVDDWALRKRHVYGTVLVDLERRRPVALLPDREADTLAAWLREHPGVEVIARSRGGAYASGARLGAPGAVQVADRFHLPQNLAEALEVALTPHAGALRRMGASDAETNAAPEPLATTPARATLWAALAAARHARRFERHDAVWTLRRQGWRVEDIVARLGIGRMTVTRHLRDPAPLPPRTRRGSGPGATLVPPWRRLVAEHWQAGQRNGRALHRELQGQGFAASYPTLARHLQALHRARGDEGPSRPKLQPGQRTDGPARAARLTPRAAACPVLRKRPDTAVVTRLSVLDPAVAEAISACRATSPPWCANAGQRASTPGWRGRKTAWLPRCGGSLRACWPTTTRCARR